MSAADVAGAAGRPARTRRGWRGPAAPPGGRPAAAGTCCPAAHFLRFVVGRGGRDRPDFPAAINRPVNFAPRRVRFRTKCLPAVRAHNGRASVRRLRAHCCRRRRPLRDCAPRTGAPRCQCICIAPANRLPLHLTTMRGSMAAIDVRRRIPRRRRPARQTRRVGRPRRPRRGGLGARSGSPAPARPRAIVPAVLTSARRRPDQSRLCARHARLIGRPIAIAAAAPAPTAGRVAVNCALNGS